MLKNILNLPKVIAHRGASGYAPENTFAAMKKAHELGATWVEFDVMLTKDGEAVVIHDEDLQRTTNGRGKVSDYTLAELEKLDAGSWFAPEFSGERIPELAKMLDYLQQLHIGINLEIKPTPGQEVATAKKIADILASHWLAGLPLLISSFSLATLEAFKKLAPNYPIGLLMKNWNDNWQTAADSLGSYSVHLKQQLLNQRRIEAIKNTDYQLLSYTINDPFRANQLWQWGVDSVFSDFADKILARREA